ncbi:ABC transporter ATP-binding protein [Spiroplasma gladiatoris]|uniref:ABC transporter ATP-binding protein n=1 Tax=Spiroplasma gladiatoris TaxID=2143 RepID=A0A4P7AI38_9MOLU|nr:ABC transporter ATP-binding protein [Spiroplasma gladiatoris]QBQ07343.1 ABC transporter ATP-binding protein [Spiroplasma gladiatoris]
MNAITGSTKGPFKKLLFYYYKKEYKLSILLLIMSLLIVACSILLPLLTYQLTLAINIKLSDQLGESNPINNQNLIPYWNLDIYLLISISILDIALYCVASYFYEVVAYNIGRKIEIALRNKALENLVKQDISYYSNKKTGEIITKIINDTQIIGDQAIQVPLQIGVSSLEIASAAILMLVFSWKIAILSLAIFCLSNIAMIFSFVATRKKLYKAKDTITKINGDVVNRLSAISLIKSSGTEEYETKRFVNIHQKYYDESKKVNTNQAMMLTIIWGGIFVLNFSSILLSILIYGIFAEPNEGLSFFKYKLASFQLAQSMLTAPLFQIMNALIGLMNASVSSQRIIKTMESKPKIKKIKDETIKGKNIWGDIKFEDIDFVYPEKPGKKILEGFNYVFKKGKSYAIVGETGSGKSTIIKLLLRFYDPTNGKVLLNNDCDLKEISLSKYLSNVGYVEQEPQILYGNVFENVKYGNFKMNNKKIIEACKKAGLHELIMSWPEKYNTILGERGVMLSGGQKQRLVIARMFLKNPKLLLLDEATSALDSKVEKEIQAKLYKLMQSRTTIIVAHRLATIKKVDEIIVLGSNGKGIIQKGAFDKLKSMEGPFKELYEASKME